VHILGTKSETMLQYERIMLRLEYKNKMDHKGIGCENVE